VTLNYWHSLSWFPSSTDLSRVTKLSLYLFISILPQQEGIVCMGHLLRQMPNISSLIFFYVRPFHQHALLIGEACLAVMQHVKPSTLKYLNIPISHHDHAKMLLDRFRALLSINFRFTSSLIIIDAIVDHLRTLTTECLITGDEYSVARWLGKRLEMVNYF
jgi:hypothetical protein